MKRSPERDSETRLIVENMPGFAWSAGPDGGIKYLNRHVLEFTGKRAEDLKRFDDMASLGWAEVIHAEDVDRTLEAWAHCVETAESYDVEHRIRRFDGTYRWFRGSATPVRDRKGRVTRWCGVHIDVDDRKKAEEALRKSEQELRLLIETLPAMVWRTTPEGEPSYVNRRFAEYSGRSLEDLVNLQWQTNHVHPDDVETVARMWVRARETQAPFENIARVRRADGSYRWFQSRGEPMRDEAGRITHWYGVDVDIDDWKKAEDSLRKSEQELRLLIDTLPAMVWRTTPDGVADYVNRRWLSYNGASLEQVADPGWVKTFLHPEDADAHIRAFRRARETGASYEITGRLRGADAVYRSFHTRVEPLRDDAGRVVHWYGVDVDIDELKKAGEALRKSEQELRLLSDTLPAMVWRATPGGDPDYINQRLADYLGRGVGEMRQEGWRTILHPDDVDRAAREWAAALEAEISLVGQYRFRRADGAYRWFQFHSEPLRDSEGRIVHWYGVQVDIDDRKKAEEALRATQARLHVPRRLRRCPSSPLPSPTRSTNPWPRWSPTPMPASAGCRPRPRTSRGRSLPRKGSFATATPRPRW
jgi:PAS domain S-box-containing protein